LEEDLQLAQDVAAALLASHGGAGLEHSKMLKSLVIWRNLNKDY
jgi:hypothetical protein